jgi:UPF0271 protein
MARIDLNSDLGESFGAYTLGMDEEVIACMTSVNIACAAHAGDPLVMARTVRTAKRHGVAVGAHPGYPDLQGFGRRAMALSPEEVRAYVLYQMGALDAFVRAEGLTLAHVKAHGSLYNTAAVDIHIALAIGRAIKDFGSHVIYCGLAGSKMEEAAGELGLPFASEVFADRGYRPDGTLVPRGQPGAMIEDVDLAAARVVRMVQEGKVTASDGSDLALKAHTVCLHGDNAQAVDFARQIRRRLEAEGIDLAPMARCI